MSTILDNKTSLGKVIFKESLSTRKNQAWLAKQIDVSENHISIICSKIKSPKIETLLKISKALDIDVDELLKAVSENLKERRSWQGRQE